MPRKRIEDLTNVETEHLLGTVGGKGLVVLRCESKDTVLLAHLAPAQARDIAVHLFESAARAEYEEDFNTAAATGGMEEPVIGMILQLIRKGEFHRMTQPEEE